MTAQEAIKVFNTVKAFGKCHLVGNEQEEFFEVVYKSLEKQIPKKMKHLTECANEGYYCPTCSKKLFKKEVINKHKCCYNCGQRINYNECDEY